MYQSLTAGTIACMYDPHPACPRSVSISLNTTAKHELPVEESCPWWHANSIAKRFDACRPFDGGIRNYADLWSCVEEARCQLTGEKTTSSVQSTCSDTEYFLLSSQAGRQCTAILIRGGIYSAQEELVLFVVASTLLSSYATLSRRVFLS